MKLILGKLPSIVRTHRMTKEQCVAHTNRMKKNNICSYAEINEKEK